MPLRIRAARLTDIRSLYDLAKLTGGGFTNLPAEKATLQTKLETSERGFSRKGDSPGDDLYVFMLEDFETGAIRGTCQVFGSVGNDRPFYSYLISTLTQKSEELGRIFRNQTLNLTTDMEGSSEVGGLFLHPNERAGGLGMLLARSRYLFIKQHRPRFGEMVMAELRGVMDQGGHSPFWDAIGGRFFGMTFPEADEFNAIHGTQFIADLFPKTPIYISMLPEAARAVMGQPHPTGRAALKMLENEGFIWDGYVDIFDGGPTVTCRVDQVKTVMNADWKLVAGTGNGGTTMMLAAGTYHDFVCCYGQVSTSSNGELLIDDTAMRMLNVGPGDRVLAVAR